MPRRAASDRRHLDFPGGVIAAADRASWPTAP
jgi:hypothetical protein